MSDQYALIEKVKGYLPSMDEALLKQALEFSEKAHEKQHRASGEKYFEHPLAVAHLLADMKLDLATIITALLHDTVEDTDVTVEDVKELFGEEVAQLVDGITKLTKIEYQPERIRQAENFRKLLVALSEDIRVLLVKLADRLHNMQTLHYVKSPEKRLKKAHETMEIYVPLAERIGVHTYKKALEEVAFQELYPDVCESINSRLDFLRSQDDQLVDRVIQVLYDILAKEAIEADISGREKTPCAIWHKMERKNISFEQLSDIIAFRILVDDVSSCYKVLGVIHSLYHTVPDSFKDFISNPKNNGYQSLHTVVIGPERQVIEVQIRTHEMHEVAEYGVAAHWSYKQNEKYALGGKQYRWVRELLEILERTSSPEEFLEHTKLQMHYNQVFCFTPQGDLIALPKGATPVDFAYAVHTQLGNSCIGTKINGRVMPLRTELDNGDQVEIICSESQTPSVAWEKFVVTGKARSEIRRFTKAQQRQQYHSLGKTMLQKAMKEAHIKWDEAILEPILPMLHKKTLEDLYAAVGEGFIEREDVLKALSPERMTKVKKPLFGFLPFQRKKPEKSNETSVIVDGLIPGQAMHYAECCHPLPGDPIVGIVTSGRGLTIHVMGCETLEHFTDVPEQWVEVSWGKSSHEHHYNGQLHIVLTHELGSLAEMTCVIAEELGNITNLKITSRSTDFFELVVNIEVKGANHFMNIVSALRSLPCVNSVMRVGGN